MLIILISSTTADSISYEELQNVTLAQLLTRIKDTETAQRKPDITNETKTCLVNAYAAAKLTLDFTKAKLTTLHSLTNDLDPKNGVYHKMSVQEFMVGSCCLHRLIL